ncbi:MAG TPA: trehalose-6-phosphate synthase [Dehalococcoidia bacterium]|nr:trehalose-6-phosphate synthase [Dehalococcoidia bacterium]
MSRSGSGSGPARLLTVSNRGPVEFNRDEDGRIVPVPGRGGLSTALYAVAQARLAPMVWLSSPLTPLDRALAEGACFAEESDTLDGAARFVLTDPVAYEQFYATFANEVLWFLQHSMPWPEGLTIERRVRAWFEGYLPVNLAFAQAVVNELDGGRFSGVMFHDYLFYAAPRLVRDARPNAFLQHFVHIPWPEPEVWERMEPEVVRDICDGLLANDSVVFQTPADVHNFLLTVEAFVEEARVDLITGQVGYKGRSARVWSNAISVDPEELEVAAASPEFSRYRYLLRADTGQKTIVRVDRLDPTKNVYRGFEAYERLLEDHTELHGKVCFLALLVPTKTDIAAYQRYQDDTIALADSINKRFGNLHWKPIRVMFEHNRMQALAAMSLYDVLLVNPLADGMNLVAKEAPFLNSHDGVVVLSHKAGAYSELSVGALGIDPKDVGGTAEALYQALRMEPQERHQRWSRIRDAIRNHDLRDWFHAFLKDIEEHAKVADTSAA